MSAVWDVTNESVTAGREHVNHVRIVHDGLKLCMRLADGRDVEVDLRTALHVAEALHLPTRVDQSTPLAVNKTGEYVGVQRSKAGGYVAFYKGAAFSTLSGLAGEVAVERARAVTRKRKQLDAEEARDTDTSDVEFVGERTREERDAEGRANAVDVDF